MYLRLLTAEEYGIWAKFNLMLQFIQPIMCWGLLATMTRLLAVAGQERREHTIAAALKMVTVLNAGLLLMLAVLVVTQQRFLQPLAVGQQLNLLVLAALAAALAAYPNILMGVYVADSKALHYRSMSLIGFALQAAVLGACASQFAMNAKMAILAMIAAASGYAALSAYRLARAAKWNAPAPEYKALLMFGVPVVLYTITGQSNDLIARYVLSSTVSSADFGAFSAGLLYASVVAMLCSAINLAWVPLFYRRAQEWMASGGVYRQFVDVFAASMAIFAAFLIIFSTEFLTLYSGGSVQLDVSVVGMLIVSAWLNGAIWMGLSNPLFYEKRLKTVLVIVLVATSASIPLALFLIPRYGMLGASLSMLFNSTFLCLITALMLRKLGLPNLSYTKLALILFLLIFISSPLMNFIYQTPYGLQRVAEKSVLFVIFAALTFMLALRSGLNVLQAIESDSA